MTTLRSPRWLGRWIGIILLLLVCPFLFISAAPQISIPSPSAVPGSTVLIPVSLVTSGQSISGLQFDVQFDNSAMGLTAAIADASQNASKSLYSAQVAAGKIRFLIIGLNQTAIADGVLLNFSLGLNASLAPGTYTLGISNVVCVDPNGSLLPITSNNATVMVSGASTGVSPLQPEGVVNAASWKSGPIAPGEIVTLFGAGIGPPPPVPSTIWTTDSRPGTLIDPDGNSVEVGVRFRSDVNGLITAIRCYRGTAATATLTGHLWSKSGSLLGTATFTGQSAPGWQQAAFPGPIAIQAGTTYIASYYAPGGHYSSDSGFFSSAAVDRPPLHALADGVDGPNGVFVYGASAFPTQSYKSTNYWVDVVFTPPASSSATNTPVVLFGGIPAPVLFATTNQINTVVPYGVPASGNTSIQVQMQGQVIGQAQVPLAAAAPGLFSTDGSGIGQGAILNQDQTVNSAGQPAARGTIVSLFGTGAGNLDSNSRVSLPVSVQIGGLPADVLYAGPAPGLTAGALQINCRVPTAITTSGPVPVSVQIGSFSSQASITIALQ